MSEHGRHLPQYFTLFVMYASLGAAEKTQLLRLNVPATFIQVALDEGPGPPIKYQYAELSKLYQVRTYPSERPLWRFFYLYTYFNPFFRLCRYWFVAVMSRPSASQR